MIDTILALHNLDERTAGYLVEEIFAHGALDVRRTALAALPALDDRWATAKLIERLT